MFEMLVNLLNKPVLWQRSSESFWDDEHISKGMLKAHLDPDSDLASRKHEFIDRSVKWLSGFLPSEAAILDLGCGPGLYAKRFSDMGFDVTGIDYSKRSLEYAKSHDDKTGYLYGNYLEIEENCKFDMAIMIYCDYAALTLAERQKLLKIVYNAVKPGGLFIFDVSTTNYFNNHRTNNKPFGRIEYGGFWSPRPYICLEATHLYEENTIACDQYVIIENYLIKEYIIWDTAFTQEKMLEEISGTGFVLKDVFDDVCGSAYTKDSETMCFVLKKQRKLLEGSKNHV